MPRNANGRDNDNVDYVCYSGIGALRKSGIHTRKEFMKMMNKEWNKDCRSYIKRRRCKSCKIMSKLVALSKRAFKPYEMGGSKNEYFNDLMNKCYKCRHNTTKKCKFKDYILFSGAQVGKNCE